MKTKVDRKKIQRDRVKKYFLDASVEIIKNEGLDNLTTKKIGDKAGYSYATIYNYFENFNELICISMLRMANECADFINENLKGDNIYEICYSFSDLIVEYNATNTNIYYPFLSSTIDFSYFQNDEQTHFIHPAYNIILEKIKNSNEFKDKNPDELKIMLDIFTSIFHSALHFYIILNNPKTIDELKSEIKKQVAFILQHY